MTELSTVETVFTDHGLTGEAAIIADLAALELAGLAETVVSYRVDDACCEICRYPGGEKYCSDRVECNYRARRRLKIPRDECMDLRASELEARDAGINHPDEEEK